MQFVLNYNGLVSLWVLVCSEVTLKLILVTTRLLTIKKDTGNVKRDSSFKKTLKCPEMLYNQSVKKKHKSC